MSMTIFGGTTLNGYEIDDCVDDNRDLVVRPAPEIKGRLPEGIFARITSGPEDANGDRPIFVAAFDDSKPYDPLWAEKLIGGWEEYLDKYGNYTEKSIELMNKFLTNINESQCLTKALDEEIASLKSKQADITEKLAKAEAMRETIAPSAISKAKELIRNFCLKEYGDEPDFSDLSHVGLAYTEFNDCTKVETLVDLESPAISTYIDGMLHSHTEYDTLEDLISNELENLDFDALVRIDDDELELETPPEGTARTEYALEVYEGGTGRFLRQVDVYQDFDSAKEELENMPPLGENEEYGFIAIYYDKDDNEIGTERIEVSDIEYDEPER